MITATKGELLPSKDPAGTVRNLVRLSPVKYVIRRTMVTVSRETDGWARTACCKAN